MPKFIKLEPNYPALFERFLHDAVLHLQHMSPEQASIARPALASLNVAIQSITNTDQLEQLRQQLADAVAALATLADRHDLRESYDAPEGGS